MKRSIILTLGLSCVSPLFAQTGLSGNPMVAPKKNVPRSIGGSVNPGAAIASAPSEKPIVRYVSHIVLYENRIWTSTEGKPLQAKLIAFEDLTAEAPKGAPAPEMPPPPTLPTVTRGGKVRLLVEQKVVELALSRLSQSDQEFIDQIKAALAKKSAAKE